MPRFDALLVLSLCCLSGALWLPAPWPASCALLLLLYAARHGVSRVSLLLGLLLLWLSAWRATHQVRDFKARHELTLAQLPQPERCVLQVRVHSSPVVRAENPSYLAQVLGGTCEQFVVAAGHLVRVAGGPSTVRRGDEVELTVQLSVSALLRNRDLSDAYLAAARRGNVVRASVLSASVLRRSRAWPAYVDQAREHVRQRIEATFAPAAVGMAKALVLGENDLSAEEDSAFKASGLAHLLAVSGTHLVFAVVSLVTGLRYLLVRVPALAERVNVARVAAAVGALLALLYADFAGGSGSAWRAAWMLSAALAAQVCDREANAARSVAVSLITGWLYDSLAVFDISFLLSASATFGLLTLGCWGSAWSQRWVLPHGARLAVDGLVATLSSMLPCAVILALMSPELSALGVFANVLAAPFGETVALPLCLSHALLSWLPPVEQGVAWVASGALLVVRRLALWVGNSDWLRLEVPYPNPWQVTLVVLGLMCPFLLRGLKQRGLALLLYLGCCAVGLCGLEWAQARAHAPVGRLRFTALDVGQGDAALVDLPNGQLMLIDAGGSLGGGPDPGSRVVLPTLRARRREHVDFVVLSHPHPDHFGGLQAVLDGVSVGELWDTGQGEQEGAGPAYAALLSRARQLGIPVRRPETLCGEKKVGGLTLRVVGPCPSFTPQLNANDNSFVLHLSFGARAVLLTGDAEREQEAGLVAKYGALLRADLLKVGHHGSRTSSTDPFLAQVQPRLATISCGQGNRYGHPHAPTLSALERHGAQLLRTDVTGSITWQTDGERVRVLTFQD